MFKKLGLAAAVAAFATSAFAADMSAYPQRVQPAPRYTQVAPAWSWTGFYAGLNGGWGSGNALFQDNFTYERNKLHGALFGGQVGYNYQFGWVVLGIETDYQWANISGSRTIDLCAFCGGALDTAKATIQHFGTTRGRVGVPLLDNRLLVYGTFGAAYGEAKVDRRTVGLGVNYHSLSDDMLFGPAYGGGLEYAFANNWSAKFEYLHLDFKQGSGSFSDNLGYSSRSKLSTDIFRGGINYKF